MMKIAILRLGQADPLVISGIQENLNTIFPNTTTALIMETMQLPEEAYAESRQQYRSNIILHRISEFAQNHVSFDLFLGIVDVDLFLPRLSFVFGEAECPGKAAVISLWRLKPEFYRKKPDNQILVHRTTKEAVHELGHTLGLKHCANPFCVMYFSNSIFETDRKQSLFCNKCYMKTMITADKGNVVGRQIQN